MNDSNPSVNELGANVRRAAVVMRAAHESTSTLLGLLDELMGPRSWVPAYHKTPNWVGLWMSGAQIGEHDNWMAVRLQRAYVARRKGGNKRDRLLLCEIDLLPERYDEAVFAMLAVQLREPTDVKAIARSWRWEESAKWHPGPPFGEVDVEPDMLARLLYRLKATGRGRVTSLCELNRQNLESKVVDTALSLFERR